MSQRRNIMAARLLVLRGEIIELQRKITRGDPDLRNLAHELDIRFREVLEMRWKLMPLRYRAMGGIMKFSDLLGNLVMAVIILLVAWFVVQFLNR